MEIKEYIQKITGGFLYEESLEKKGDYVYGIIKRNNKKFLVIKGKNSDDFEYEGKYEDIWVCPLTHYNATLLREKFPYTNPCKVLNNDISFGFGDRLGIITYFHLKSIEGYSISPVLAQQSMRELNLTRRTYQNVLDDVSWQVFQAGYKKGFGADADHLKIKEDILSAIDTGFTMITVDLSEKINPSVYNLSEEQINRLFPQSDEAITIFNTYANKTFSNKELCISYTPLQIKKIYLIYKEAIHFLETLKDICGKVELEISMDETSHQTPPEDHFFMADQLIRRGITFKSLAPRFYGEFEKAIDYKGDIEKFKEDLIAHVGITEMFDKKYKISIHSGSDKFSVFPLIGSICEGRFHIKTAGTSWVNAIECIAQYNPELFEKIIKIAIENFEKAKQFYHISTTYQDVCNKDIFSIKCGVEGITDPQIRQLIHITYGYILGNKEIKEEIFNSLFQKEREFGNIIKAHFRKHFELLKIPKK